MTTNLSIDAQQKLDSRNVARTETVFSVDAETDGLYGPTLAIGVVGQIPGSRFYFQGRCPDSIATNDWVKENVLPAIAGMPVIYDTPAQLEAAFWEFWMAHKSKTGVVIAHCAHPVESGLFRRCVEVAPDSRMWDGPFPAIHDVATLLLQKGEDPASVDSYISKHGLAKPTGSPHNPIYDATAALTAWNHLRKHQA